MTPEEIKALRKELACTARELGTALGVGQATVFAWERGELFPTKQYVDRMAALRAEGTSAIPRTPKVVARREVARASSSGRNAMHALANPAFWQVVRKLAAHDELWKEVVPLAANYSDPADSSPPDSPASPEAASASRSPSPAATAISTPAGGSDTTGEG